jgi:hypothetical protein
MPISSEQSPCRTRTSLKDNLKQAFAVGSEFEDKLADDEDQLLKDIALNIHKRRLTAAAIPFIMFNRPLNVLGANMLQMGEMIMTAGPVEQFLRMFLGPNYTHELLVRTLEKRCAIDRLVELLEEHLDERP